MMFAKLVNGVPMVQQQPLTIGRRKVYTNDAGLWLSQGYKKLIETPRPELQTGEVAVEQYRETETEIIKEWRVIE